MSVGYMSRDKLSTMGLILVTFWPRDTEQAAQLSRVHFPNVASERMAYPPQVAAAKSMLVRVDKMQEQRKTVLLCLMRSQYQ